MTDEYILKEWENDDHDYEAPKIKILDENELWKILNESKSGSKSGSQKDRKISIFKLGKCIIDWS